METNLLRQNPRPNIYIVDTDYGDGMPIPVSTTSLLYVDTVCVGVMSKKHGHHFQ